MVIYVSKLSRAPIRLVFQIFPFHIAGCVFTCVFTKGELRPFYNKSDEKEKIYEALDPELSALSELSVLSHGLKFHRCATRSRRVTLKR